jgi:hypothetical protein
MGGHDNLIKHALRELVKSDLLPKEGLFENIPVNVEGCTIYMRGKVIDGIVRVSTFFST